MNNILIVDLDEDFIKNYGGWPLPRSLYGDLITTTNAIAGITVLMPNPDIRGKDYDEYFCHENGVQTNSPCFSSIDTSYWD